ncbi:MAG: pilus assembly protein TadG-related protein [Candidatus Dormiibacterota bacterium]
MSRGRRNRLAQRGQVLVVAALMAVLIFGVLALAVDLGVQTMSQRSMQNISDAGALAGASDLGTNVGLSQQKLAINDAVATVGQNLGGSWSGGTAPAPVTCGSGYCASGTMASGGASYTVSVSTPPQNARSSSNAGVNDLEVDLSTKVQNGFASVIGAPASVVRAHAVAYHWGPPGPYDYTFFAAQDTESGNQQESIYGDAFVGDGYQPQSQGKAGFCVYDPAGSTAYGHLIFAVYPPTIGPEPQYGYSAACPGGGALTAQAPEPQSSAPTNCPAGSSPAADPNTGVWGCVMPNTPVPDITGANCSGAPWYDASSAAAAGCQTPVCSTTFNSSTPAGIYPVKQNCTATLDFSGGNNINCVSLELSAGASVNIINKKGQQYVTSYGFSQDPTSDNEIGAIGAPLPANCPGSTTEGPTDADDCVICAAPSSVSPAPVVLANSSTGCCSDTLFVGSIFVPDQEISFSTNQAMEDVGQVYCGVWDVQSGNHPNPLVTRDVQQTGLQGEELRLVE